MCIYSIMYELSTEVNFDYDEYKKNTTKKSGKFFVAMFVIIGFLLALSFANLFSLAMYSSGLSLLSGYDIKSNKFYTIQIEYYSDYNQARDFAQTLTIQGAAGYIYFDGGYRVLASCYTKYSEAESVIQNIKSTYSNAKVYTIDTQKITYPSNLNKSQLGAFKNVLQSMQNSINSLLEISTGFDKGDTNEQNVHTELNTCYTNFENSLASFDQNIKGEIAIKYARFKMYVKEFGEKLAKTNTLTTQNNELSSNIKYIQLNCLISYKNALTYLSF